MKILLLGGTGIISKYVLDLCIKDGHEVTIFNRGNSNRSIPITVTTIIGDYKKLDVNDSAFSDSNYDVIIDFLSRKPSELSLLYKLLKEHCDIYVFISTACVYLRNENNKDECISEDAQTPNYNWSYSIEKHLCEEFLKSEAKSFNKKYIIARPYITYGDTRIPCGLEPNVGCHWSIIGRIMAGKPLFVWDDGNAISTFTHSSDFAKALLGIIYNHNSINQEFNITSDQTCRWEEMLMMLYDICGCDYNVVKIPSHTITKNIPRFTNILLEDRRFNARFNNSKLKSAVPGISFDTCLYEGLKSAVEYYQNPIHKKNDNRYDADVDRLIEAHTSIKMRFIDYGRAQNKPRNCTNWLYYSLYKHIHPKHASYIMRLLKKIT